MHPRIHPHSAPIVDRPSPRLCPSPQLESEVARVQRLVDSAPVPDPRDREELARLRTELAEMGDAPR